MIDKRKKVLLITFHFPPKPGIASVRMKGLAKYLPACGWDPTILTVDLPGEPQEGFRVIQVPYPGDVTSHIKRKLRLDPQQGFQDQIGIPDQVSLAKDPLTGKLIKRLEGWLTYPDQKRFWIPLVVKALRDLLREESFQGMISSSPPEVTHLIASQISREYGLPWVADFRDLWTGNHYYPYDALRKIFDRRLELNTITEASALVTVSDPLCKTLASIHPDKLIVPIPNGFDPDEIENADLHKEFTITYTGQLYQGKRDPELLLQVIRDLLDEGKIQDDLLIKFYGQKVYWVEALIEKYGLEKIAVQYGIVDRREAVKQQRASQILLSLNWDNPQEEGVYTGKIFEYLAAKRPILALGGPGGVVKDLLRETETGIHTQDPEELRRTITTWYEEFQRQGYIVYTGTDQIHNYSHEIMAQKYAKVLNRISLK